MPSLPKTTLNWRYFTKFEEQCKSSISMCCGTVKPCVISSAKKMLPAIRKDVVPTIQ